MRTVWSLRICLSPCVTLFCGQVILDFLSRIGALSDEKVKITLPSGSLQPLPVWSIITRVYLLGSNL